MGLPTRLWRRSARWGLRDFKVDAAAKTVTVGAGLRYGDLAVQLDKAGYRAGEPGVAAAYFGGWIDRHGDARVGVAEWEPGDAGAGTGVCGGRRQLAYAKPRQGG